MTFSKTILFIGVFGVSCHKQVDFRPDFAQTESLSVFEVRPIEGVFMRYPFRIRLQDSVLFVMNLHTTDYYCNQFDYPSMRHRQSFVKKGKGPGEFLDAENIRLAPDGGCWVLDANNTKMACFPANDSLATELKLDSRLIRTLDFALYGDSSFIVPDYTGLHRFHILRPDGQIEASRGQIPVRKRDASISDAAYAQAWRGFLDYNPENGLLAVVTQLGEVMEIYSIPGDSLVNIVYGSQGEPQFKYRDGYAIPTGIMGYSDVYVGRENIYALFWGYTFEDIKQERVKTEGGNLIRVFDLKGNPVKQYSLDRYITGFCLNEETGTLLGLDVNSDQPVIELKTKKILL
jgi:hypothetical protein